MKRYIFVLVLVLAAGISYIWYQWPSYMVAQVPKVPASDQLAKMGQYGDSYGAFTAAFAALAFVGSVIAISMQAHQLRQMKKRLDEEEAEQKETLKLVRQQADAMALTATLNAHTARIEAYRFQLDGALGDAPSRLQKERSSLIAELDTILRDSLQKSKELKAPLPGG